MTENTINKLMLGFQLSLAVIMLVCMTLTFGYHLLAGNLRQFPFFCFTAMMVISYKMLRWAINEYKEEMAKS